MQRVMAPINGQQWTKCSNRVVFIPTLQTSLLQEDEDYITQPQTIFPPPQAKGNKNEKKDKLNLQTK